nr:MAG TPA: hypothetical protein [Caudoviricetes sp.]
MCKLGLRPSTHFIKLSYYFFGIRFLGRYFCYLRHFIHLIHIISHTCVNVNIFLNVVGGLTGGDS